MSDKRVKEDYFTFAKLKAWSQANWTVNIYDFPSSFIFNNSNFTFVQ